MQCTAHNAMCTMQCPTQFTQHTTQLHKTIYAVNRHAVNCTTVLDTQKHSSSDICTEQEFTTVSQTTRLWNIRNPIF